MCMCVHVRAGGLRAFKLYARILLILQVNLHILMDIHIHKHAWTYILTIRPGADGYHY